MKKLILLLVIVLFAADGPQLHRTKILPEQVEGWNVAVFEIDGCEYLGLTSGAAAAWFLTHKGNCKYCEKRNNKEQPSSYTPPIQPYKSRYLDR